MCNDIYCEYVSGGICDIDHEYASAITCPYCGYKFTDSYEYFPDELEWCEDLKCLSCDKLFTVDRTVTIEYSTCKMEVSMMTYDERQEILNNEQRI